MSDFTPNQMREMADCRANGEPVEPVDECLLVMADRIEELERQKTASMREATNLAWALYRRFYQDQAPQWAPLEEVCGIISQIDNMTAGMADRVEELQGHAEAAEAKLARAVAAAYEDAAKIAIDYVNGDLAQPEMGIWWNIMKSAQSDASAALERVRREARNEALEEALLMAELYPRPHGSRIANNIRAMMINDNDHIENLETELTKAEDDWAEYPPEVVRVIQALIKLKRSDDEREYMIGHKLLSTWDNKR